jgi:zinc protease
MMMGNGNNSIFYKTFVKAKPEIAVAAQVNHRSKELGGEFSIQIFAYPPEDFNLEKLFSDIDAKVKATIDEFGTSGITDDALARAKAEIESSMYGSLSTIGSKAGTISEWERLLGKGYTLSDEIDRYNKVTKDDITRVFTKYIKGAGAAVLNTYPIMNQKDSVKSINPYANMKFETPAEYKGLTYQPVTDNFKREERPAPGPAKTVTIPEYFTSKLSNGISSNWDKKYRIA